MKKIVLALGMSFVFLMGNVMVVMADIATFDRKIVKSMSSVSSAQFILIMVLVLLLVFLAGLVLIHVNKNRKK